MRRVPGPPRPLRPGLRLVEVADASALARAAADAVVEHARAAVGARGAFAVALAGGSTPAALYHLLADARGPWRAAVAWDRVHVFFGDERSVPPDHADSNFRLADEALLRHVPVAAVHRMEGERPAEEAARAYEARLARRFGAGPPPRLDLVLLGLGADGHTASLFPGSPALEERLRWVAAPWVPAVGAHRLTLTLPVLDAAAAVLFLVAGASKREPLAALLAPPDARAGAPIPAARVAPAGSLTVMADRAALGG